MNRSVEEGDSIAVAFVKAVSIGNWAVAAASLAAGGSCPFVVSVVDLGVAVAL